MTTITKKCIISSKQSTLIINIIVQDSNWTIHFFSVLRLSPNTLVEVASNTGPSPKGGIPDPKEAACPKDVLRIYELKKD